MSDLQHDVPPPTNLDPSPTVRRIDKSSRRALFASWLGWTFDGFETYALVLVGPAAVTAVGTDVQLADLPAYVSGLVAATLAGWALGGILAGFAADRLGRRRTLIISIFWYALFTGLTALAPDYWWLLVLRFITGMGLGAEWGSATALIGELWPNRSRGRAAAFLQSGFGVGAVIAALAWFLLQPVGDNAWRYLFLVGTLPALIVLYVRRAVRDPELWISVRDRRLKAKAAYDAGTATAADRELLRSPFTAVFSEPHLRRRGLRLLVLTVVSVIGLYAVSAWIPQYTIQLAREAGETGTRWGANAGLVFNAASVPGYLLLGYLADRWGRKPTMLLYYIGSAAIVPVFFFAVHTPQMALVVAAAAGFFILGQFAWMPIYMPELFPTSGRATAISSVFNSARLAGALVVLGTGMLISLLGGITTAATIVGVVPYLIAIGTTWFVGPETKGQPLPR
ncbi:MFS transporter [Streptomyces sp. 11-1-2]|uniref:MFS transporter n=1 Tax=unclassified Streptomyces TaxID=2593676 RepID=UPI000B8D83AA|nr:MFS transporter [Streptomyces sp. 11-1-2]ASQ91901.1 MFS transporter [Streptomyces sp. 11-1-2]